MKNVIIGNGPAGISAAEAIRKIDKNASITIISDEKFGIYSRCLLTYYLSGEIARAQLLIRPDNFFEKLHIQNISGNKVTKVLNNRVLLEDGRFIEYDKLLLATGASAKNIDIHGSNIDGLFTMRRFDDVIMILSRLKDVKTAAIIGGGLVGIKTTTALIERGIKVKMLIGSNRVLSQMADLEAGKIIKSKLEQKGVEIKTEVLPKEIMSKSAQITGIMLNNGETVECDMAVVAKGVMPNCEIVRDMGINVNSAIVVDETMRTSNPNIFAAGDVAETMDIALQSSRVNAIWPCAVEQGKITGANMAGMDKRYAGSLRMNSISCFGYDIISMGIIDEESSDYEIFITKKDQGRGLYHKLIFKDDILCGALLVNDIYKAGILQSLIKKRIKLTKFKNDLLTENLYSIFKFNPTNSIFLYK